MVQPLLEILVNGKDYIPYMKWKIKHVWNHQPVTVRNQQFASLSERTAGQVSCDLALQLRVLRLQQQGSPAWTFWAGDPGGFQEEKKGFEAAKKWAFDIKMVVWYGLMGL